MQWTWVCNRKLVMDREVWRAAVHGVAKSRIRLSDWTELNWSLPGDRTGAPTGREPSSLKVILQKHPLICRVWVGVNLAPTGLPLQGSLTSQSLTSEPGGKGLVVRRGCLQGWSWRAGSWAVLNEMKWVPRTAEYKIQKQPPWPMESLYTTKKLKLLVPQYGLSIRVIWPHGL